MHNPFNSLGPRPHFLQFFRVNITLVVSSEIICSSPYEHKAFTVFMFNASVTMRMHFMLCLLLLLNIIFKLLLASLLILCAFSLLDRETYD